MYLKAVCSWGLEEPKASPQQAQVALGTGNGGAKGEERKGCRDRNTFGRERQEANIICQVKAMADQFGFPQRVGSGQGGTCGKVKILSFGS